MLSHRLRTPWVVLALVLLLACARSAASVRPGVIDQDGQQLDLSGKEISNSATRSLLQASEEGGLDDETDTSSSDSTGESMDGTKDGEETTPKTDDISSEGEEVSSDDGEPTVVEDESGSSGASETGAIVELGPEYVLDNPQQLLFSIKVFTCNRNESLHRLLTSLSKADYAGHRVDLEIIVDHCPKRSARLRCLGLARNFTWPHGHYALRVREKKAGLRVMWFEAWYPANERNIGIIFEDDMEVSTYFYRFAYQVISEYYLKQHDPNLIGLCLNPFGLPKLAKPFYKSRSICSWGSVLVPTTWKRFLAWVDEHITIKNYKPMLPKGYQLSFHRWSKVNYWMRANKDVWTSWFYRFIYESESLFTISYCLNECSEGLAINHQEAGTNYPTTMETQWKLVTRPLNTYYGELPLFHDMEFRLDGLIAGGPCRKSSCPVVLQLDKDPVEVETLAAYGKTLDDAIEVAPTVKVVEIKWSD